MHRPTIVLSLLFLCYLGINCDGDGSFEDEAEDDLEGRAIGHEKELQKHYGQFNYLFKSRRNAEYYLSSQRAYRPEATLACKLLSLRKGKIFKVVILDDEQEAKEVAAALQSKNAPYDVWTNALIVPGKDGTRLLVASSPYGKKIEDVTDKFRKKRQTENEEDEDDELPEGKYVTIQETLYPTIEVTGPSGIPETKCLAQCGHWNCNVTTHNCTFNNPLTGCTVTAPEECNFIPSKNCTASCEACDIIPPSCTVKQNPCKVVKARVCTVSPPTCETKGQYKCTSNRPPCTMMQPEPCKVLPEKELKCIETKEGKICRENSLYCTEPNHFCPIEHIECELPKPSCSLPQIKCEEPEIDCPAPTIVCTKPTVHCKAPKLHCPTVVASCSAAKVNCPDPPRTCPAPTVECEPPPPCHAPGVVSECVEDCNPLEACECTVLNKSKGFTLSKGECKPGDGNLVLCEEIDVNLHLA